jgi:hypothetical protein
LAVKSADVIPPVRTGLPDNRYAAATTGPDVALKATHRNHGDQFMLKFLTASCIAAGLAASITAAIGVSSARAEIEYPWCAVYTGGMASTNCGFTSLQQCLETIRGLPGTCSRNPAYPSKTDRRPGKPRDR